MTWLNAIDTGVKELHLQQSCKIQVNIVQVNFPRAMSFLLCLLKSSVFMSALESLFLLIEIFKSPFRINL